MNWPGQLTFHLGADGLDGLLFVQRLRTNIFRTSQMRVVWPCGEESESFKRRHVPGMFYLAQVSLTFCLVDKLLDDDLGIPSTAALDAAKQKVSKRCRKKPEAVNSKSVLEIAALCT